MRSFKMSKKSVLVVAVLSYIISGVFLFQDFFIRKPLLMGIRCETAMVILAMLGNVAFRILIMRLEYERNEIVAKIYFKVFNGWILISTVSGSFSLFIIIVGFFVK